MEKNMKNGTWLKVRAKVKVKVTKPFRQRATVMIDGLVKSILSPF